MKVQFTVTGDCADEIRCRAVAQARKFFGPTATYRIERIACHPMIGTNGAGQLGVIWKAEVDAYETPAAPAQVTT